MQHIQVDVEKDVLTKPLDYLGSSWENFVGLTQGHGGRYNGEVNQLPRACLLPFIEDLLSHGFTPVISDAVEDTLRSTNHEILGAEGLDPRMKPYQVEGINWLRSRQAGLLGDGMGLGKTAQALQALPEGAPVVVCCPAGAKGVWVGETPKWRPGYSTRVLKGRNSWDLPQPGEIVITNYEILSDKPGRIPDGTHLIADEVHMVKGAKTQRTKRFRALAKAVLQNGGKVWLMTGTPMLNRPIELWNVLRAAQLEGVAFGSWSNFLSVMNGYQGRFGIEWGSPDSGEVAKRLQRVMLRRLKSEVLPQLPDKLYGQVHTDALDAATQRLCDETMSMLAKRGVNLGEVENIVELTRLQGADFSLISKARAALATAKMADVARLVEHAEEQGELLVVASAHRAPIDALGQREGWEVITGDVSPERRTEIVGRFQAGELKGLALTIKAGGVALTLTRSCHMIFVDLDWTPGLNEQCEDRIYRIGQDRGVVITHMVAPHAIDQKVTALLTQKEALISATVDAAAGSHVETDVEEVISRCKKEYTPVQNGRRFRDAGNPLEEWAAQALRTLAALDPDRAGVLNDVGFNGADTNFGHSLAAQVERGLSDKQWERAIKMCRKYHRQVGEAPE